MTTLLVGFDSAWTHTNSGAIVGVCRSDKGVFRDLGPPKRVNYVEAAATILAWQVEKAPTTTIVLLDQPTIVSNPTGQRSVENIVGSPIGRRYGGMQPANRSKREMFGEDAPIWQFLKQFGGPANLLESDAETRVIETYPVLTMIALLWTLPDARRPTGRLPKYNPDRRRTFSISDWRHVCDRTSAGLAERGIKELTLWVEGISGKARPTKREQDGLDACICLLVALYLIEKKDCLLVGNQQEGYIVVPYGAELSAELEARCTVTDRTPTQWVQVFRLPSINNS
jgi:predicted RNase H-like nuclease